MSAALAWAGVAGAAGAVDPAIAWTIELDRIEMDVVRCERALDEGHERGTVLQVAPWTPRHDLGPVPADLVARVCDLMARQQVCLERMEDELGRVGWQRAVTTAVTRATTPSAAPVYVDASL